MSMNRREFLKVSGLASIFGLTGLGAFELLAPGDIEASGDVRKSGIRYAMVVDMRRLGHVNDLHACIDVCHKVHNVPHIKNIKHEIKWIWTEKFASTFTGQGMDSYLSESFIKDMDCLVLCNHCDNPPCVRVCPTQATFKRNNGIVAMDYHRCIGCRFCMAACPYGARSFNFKDPRPYLHELNSTFPTRTKGVVEKCNFCVERLERGEYPACVEVSQGAIAFGNINDSNSDVSQVLNKHFCLRRKPELGTYPSVYYLIGGG